MAYAQVTARELVTLARGAVLLGLAACTSAPPPPPFEPNSSTFDSDAEGWTTADLTPVWDDIAVD